MHWRISWFEPSIVTSTRFSDREAVPTTFGPVWDFLIFSRVAEPSALYTGGRLPLNFLRLEPRYGPVRLFLQDFVLDQEESPKDISS